MATIKAIEATSVHHIQSGQVIVDLCSVVKELVENSLDAGATVVEVRFKNNGLDSIEVQDNGSGIDPTNYESVALKHFTSKLSSYDDLSSLRTFGFRGEALSSLCALSKFCIITAQANEAPKGKRLDFDSLGQLKSTSVVAAQRGTTAIVEDLFHSLPVRRKELTKNVKREYGKVLGLLHAYACIGINVRFTVKNVMPKAKNMTVFSTQGNATTRENIANIYGTKTLGALISLDLGLDFQPTLTPMVRREQHTNIRVKGHISKPVFGEGRQTPDRQMFFVNGRPCGLPQIAKAINEVYKAFNVSQSPFILADLQMDTNAYDVNVSPDKRTILIHDSASLIENLKTTLNDMFDQQDQTVPQSQLQSSRLPVYQKPNFQRQPHPDSPDIASQRTSLSDTPSLHNDSQGDNDEQSGRRHVESSIFQYHSQNFAGTRDEPEVTEKQQATMQKAQGKHTENIAQKVTEQEAARIRVDDYDGVQRVAQPEAIEDGKQRHESEEDDTAQHDPIKSHVKTSDPRLADPQSGQTQPSVNNQRMMQLMPSIQAIVQSRSDGEKGAVPNAFDRMRPNRILAELATVTVGDRSFTTIFGSQFPKLELDSKNFRSTHIAGRSQNGNKSLATAHFSQNLRQYGARASQFADEEADDDGVEKLGLSAEHGDTEATEGLETDQEDNPNVRRVNEEDVEEPSSQQDIEDTSDSDYIDEEDKRRAEEAKVADLIRAAEASSALPTKENMIRMTKALAGGRTKDSTANLQATVDFSTASVARRIRTYREPTHSIRGLLDSRIHEAEDGRTQDPEARLSLTVAKPDFAKMRIVGQFNLGFIIAVRLADLNPEDDDRSKQDELFIIDQHASDEKYNFERLQAETTVGNQRLVRPVTLELTAVEEEVVLENNDALEKNGFLVEIDSSGESMVGQRCSLISLPLSQEVIFGIRDLEELIQLLADSPGCGEADVPRPSKVRKMFAMRACRSSIMIGKTLSKKQMEKVMVHMGTIDKPWNCPHGRPTMRHLCSLNALQPWREGHEECEDNYMSLGKALRRYVEDE